MDNANMLCDNCNSLGRYLLILAGKGVHGYGFVCTKTDLELCEDENRNPLRLPKCMKQGWKCPK